MTTPPASAGANGIDPSVATPARAARERVIHPERFVWERVFRALKFGAYRAAPWACLLWLLGVGLRSTSVAAGIVQVSRLKRFGSPVIDEQLHKALQRLAHRMGVTRVVRVLVSDRIDVPSVFGWLKPVILLPVGALTGFTPGQLQALLAHELAHLRRYDYLANWVQNIIETLLFYHPAVWWVSRRIRVEREYCCDELAVQACEDPLLYARALTALETLRPTRPATALLSARGGHLLKRIKFVLEARPPRRSTFSGPAELFSLALTTSFVLMLCAPFALAQQDGRSLAFPADRPLGLVLIRDAGEPYTATGEGEGWRTYAQAQGKIQIPDGVEVMLRVTPAERVDLSPLADFDPDALQRLDVSNCNLVDEDLDAIAGLTGLKALSLNKNKQLTVRGWERLNGLTELVWLGIEQTGIVDTPEHQLAELANLEYLDAYESPFNDASAQGLGALMGLKWLGLESTKVTGAALEPISNLANLEGLTLENTAVGNEGLANLTRLENLKLLVLKKTAVTDAGVASLAASPSLETLNINGTRINSDSLDTLLTFPNLRTVDVGETSIPEDRVAAFKQALAKRVAELPDTVEPQRSTNPDAPKIGLVISHFTATGPHDMDEPYGYAAQANKAVGFLDEANFDLYAIIEPGTENEGELPVILRNAGLSRKTVDGTNVKALRHLDAIVSAWYLDVREDMLTALIQAIEQGVGYVNVGPLGLMVPGTDSEDLQRLLGIRSPQYLWGMTGSCKRASVHPILDGLSAGSAFVPDMFNGYAAPDGIEGGTVILTSPPNLPNVPKDFYPLYVHTLGQGRIVNCQWGRFTLSQTPWGQYDLYIRCINWAAKRPAEAQW
jgi:beta-lactamase regulating signal transducer with metallopeptidase domain